MPRRFPFGPGDAASYDCRRARKILWKISDSMMNPLKALLRILARCCSADADAEPGVVVHITDAIAKPKPGPKDKDCIPAIFAKTYRTVIGHDVTANEAVCITSDVAVLGNAQVEGDSCITGNLLIAGTCQAKGNICVTGSVIILGNAKAEGDICVTGDAFVKGDLAVKGKLDVGGKLCVFGSKDIQPAQP